MKLNSRAVLYCCTKRFSYIVTITTISIAVFVVYSYNRMENVHEQAFSEKLSTLWESVNYLRHMDTEGHKSLIELLKKYERLLLRLNITHDLQNQSLLYNRGDAVTFSGDLAFPNIYDYLPHLILAPHSTVPAVKVAASSKTRRNRNRTGKNSAWLTIGIPTIKRTKTSYLITTLRSLIDNLTPEEQRDVVIVVFIGEMGVTEFVRQQLTQLHSEFDAAIENGLLEIVVPDAAFYPPDLDGLPPTFGDSPERMRWRTKQNLDYAYLMMYCQNRAKFYMQLEDDVITKPMYLQEIRKFLAGKDSSWAMLEFSSLGFIGKMFRSEDLSRLVNFLLMFYRDKPVDWLLDSLFTVRYCHPEKSNKDCLSVRKESTHRRKPSLFQHVGLQSSLSGKVQKLKEKDFGKNLLHRPHIDNPKAVASTSLKVYQNFKIQEAYDGSSFFWSLLPQPGDWLKFAFETPTALMGITLRSGNAEHPDDTFRNTSVEVKPPGVIAHPLAMTDDGYAIVAWFGPTGAVDVQQLNATGDVTEVRLVVHSESDNWVILSEIHFRTSDG